MQEYSLTFCNSRYSSMFHTHTHTHTHKNTRLYMCASKNDNITTKN